MALEAVVFQEGLFSYGCKDLSNIGGGEYWSYGGYAFEEAKAYTETIDNYYVERGLNGNWESSPSSKYAKEWDTNSSSPEVCTGNGFFAGGFLPAEPPAAMSGRRKRRRTKSFKNKEEVENQRMTHITVERNRRKQMNDHLSMLRSLMPASYVQRGDQASIIGGAINFVKELEQLLQSLEAQKRLKQQPADTGFTSLFSDFFTFPQYSTCSSHTKNSAATIESTAEKRSAIADVEVTMVESHANLKLLTKRQPKQLLKMVARLHSLRLTILHLNITTVDPMVLYSISVKVEDDCQLTSVNDIASAVYEMVGRIQEEATFN
ncbi:hypothetical protein L1049_023354 [Liquidambar formosana]|uniref:BHLH domain-containing protein n=1 Tax=Liquidambar formosana TaxID=63359 RepID=A0AAP0X0H9_LIQFO